MRTYRNGIILCSLMCVVSLIPLLCNIIWQLCMAPSVENLLLGVFASAFVALVTYSGAYNIEKKKTIGLLKRYCKEYILEWSNLVPMLMEIQPDGLCKFNWAEVINKIKTSSSVHDVVVKLCKIHEERLYTVDGYFPILRKSRKNLDVHHLIIAFAKVNAAVQYCDIAYLMSTSVVCQMERDDIQYSDEELKNYIQVILQNHNDEYQNFLKLVQKVSAQGKPQTVFDPKCEEKCS